MQNGIDAISPLLTSYRKTDRRTQHGPAAKCKRSSQGDPRVPLCCQIRLSRPEAHHPYLWSLIPCNAPAHKTAEPTLMDLRTLGRCLKERRRGGTKTDKKLGIPPETITSRLPHPSNGFTTRPSLSPYLTPQPPPVFNLAQDEPSSDCYQIETPEAQRQSTGHSRPPAG